MKRTEQKLIILASLLAGGRIPDREIAAQLGVCRDTIARWKKRQEVISARDAAVTAFRRRLEEQARAKEEAEDAREQRSQSAWSRQYRRETARILQKYTRTDT